MVTERSYGRPRSELLLVRVVRPTLSSCSHSCPRRARNWTLQQSVFTPLVARGSLNLSRLVTGPKSTGCCTVSLAVRPSSNLHPDHFLPRTKSRLP